VKLLSVSREMILRPFPTHSCRVSARNKTLDSLSSYPGVPTLGKGWSGMKLRPPSTFRLLGWIVWACLIVAPAASDGSELKDETLKNWDAYIQTANSQMCDRLKGPFLWVDEQPDRINRVRAGKILVLPMGQQNPKPVASGLIHDWIGAAFIPGATLQDVLSVVRDYDHYKEFYKPTVIDSKSLDAIGGADKYSMLAVRYVRLDDRHSYSIAYTTRVQEIRHYGRPGEQKLPPNQGSGYIWRICTLAKFEERDGGVYVELEAIALSRDVPVAVRWVVDPIVRSFSKSSLLTSLRQLVAATSNRTRRPSTFAASTTGVAINSAR